MIATTWTKLIRILTDERIQIMHTPISNKAKLNIPAQSIEY